MPQAQFIPTKQIDPEEQQRTILAGIGLAQNLQQQAFENQLLTQRMNLEQARFGLDQQIAQVNIAGEQQRQSQSAATFPDRQRLGKASADLAETDAKFRPQILQGEVDNQQLAQQISQLTIEQMGLDNSTKKRLAPIVYQNALQDVEQKKAQLRLLQTQNDQIKKNMSMMDISRNDQQVREIGQNWHNMTPEQRGAARAAFPNSLLTYLPDNETDPIKTYMTAVNRVMNDPNAAPEARTQAWQVAGMALEASLGIHHPDNPMAGVLGKDGKPLFQKTATPFEIMGGLLGNPPKSSGTGKGTTPVASTDKGAGLEAAVSDNAPKFEYAPTGIGDLDNTLYHASQHASIGETVTMGNVSSVRGARVKTIQNFLNNAPTKVERDDTSFNYDQKFEKKLDDIYDAGTPITRQGPDGVALPAERSPEYKAVKAAMIVDNTATLRQQTTYETFLKNILSGDLTTKAGVTAAKQNTMKLLAKVGPDALTQAQKDALTTLVRYFDSGE